jgi:hypothetical protein
MELQEVRASRSFLGYHIQASLAEIRQLTLASMHLESLKGHAS